MEELGPGKVIHVIVNDQTKADDYRKRCQDLLNPLASLMSEANKSGFRLGWTLGYDQYGRAVIQNIDVVKPL